MVEDELVGWHHQLSGHKFEQTLGDSEGQGSLECCSPWGHKDSVVTERLNDNQLFNYSGEMNQPPKLMERGTDGDFPGGQWLRLLYPWSGNWIPYAATK